MAKINGIEGSSVADLSEQVGRGGRFVIFTYCVSILIMTFKTPTAIYYIRPGESTLGKALPFVLISMIFGWWGFPFGLIYTPWSILENLTGGRDVTKDVMDDLLASAFASAGVSLASAPVQPAPNAKVENPSGYAPKFKVG